jgi:hypothetical protein
MMSILDSLAAKATESEDALKKGLKELYADVEGNVASYGDLANSNCFVQNGTDRLPIRMEYLLDADPDDEADDEPLY